MPFPWLLLTQSLFYFSYYCHLYWHCPHRALPRKLSFPVISLSSCLKGWLISCSSHLTDSEIENHMPGLDWGAVGNAPWTGLQKKKYAEAIVSYEAGIAKASVNWWAGGRGAVQLDWSISVISNWERAWFPGTCIHQLCLHREAAPFTASLKPPTLQQPRNETSDPGCAPPLLLCDTPLCICVPIVLHLPGYLIMCQPFL
jgi:hypothetical protein